MPVTRFLRLNTSGRSEALLCRGQFIPQPAGHFIQSLASNYLFFSFSVKFLRFQNVLLANRFKLFFKKFFGGFLGRSPEREKIVPPYFTRFSAVLTYIRCDCVSFSALSVSTESAQRTINISIPLFRKTSIKNEVKIKSEGSICGFRRKR